MSKKLNREDDVRDAGIYGCNGCHRAITHIRYLEHEADRLQEHADAIASIHANALDRHDLDTQIGEEIGRFTATEAQGETDEDTPRGKEAPSE